MLSVFRNTIRKILLELLELLEVEYEQQFYEACIPDYTLNRDFRTEFCLERFLAGFIFFFFVGSDRGEEA